MSLIERFKVFVWKWGVTLISFGMYEGNAVVECTICGHWMDADDKEEIWNHRCIYVRTKEDDIN
jgi:hypothetical protein